VAKSLSEGVPGCLHGTLGVINFLKMKLVSQKHYEVKMTAFIGVQFRCDSLNPAWTVGGFAL